ncbi:hypothetical protein Q6A51_23030 [Pseudomonas sp. KFB-139]|uniref:HTH luxR-type domain-containing protein n=1 Tax=Pseudomonas serbiensis TaxID=3064350 RepID=A0ABT9CVX4_9PSED|nr:hypothetical protein [Pseudomonas sp. KFB-138]MDO7929652.1 hypothetical protein [Pseudomonas sp. KFB-138]
MDNSGPEGLGTLIDGIYDAVLDSRRWGMFLEEFSGKAGVYSEQEMQVIAALMPHMQAAFDLHRRLYHLDALAQASVNVLESSSFGIVLVDESTEVLHANTLAHSLARGSGLLAIGDDNSVCACLAAQDARLQQLLQCAVRTSDQIEGGGLRLRGPDGRQLDLVVTALPRWQSTFGERGAGAIFISNPNATIGSLTHMMRDLYGMTPAEARLTEALVNGLTPQEYAERQQVSLHTVRAQFKSAAARVGTTRQVDLVRIILTGPAVLRRR